MAADGLGFFSFTSARQNSAVVSSGGMNIWLQPCKRRLGASNVLLLSSGSGINAAPSLPKRDGVPAKGQGSLMYW